MIILCLGANDMLRGINPKETKNNLEKIIKTAQDKNIKVILGGNHISNALIDYKFAITDINSNIPKSIKDLDE